MKIDIHDLEQELIDRAIETRSIVQVTVDGTGKDGSPACATVKPTRRSLA
jgi:hypothetical protein